MENLWQAEFQAITVTFHEVSCITQLDVCNQCESCFCMYKRNKKGWPHQVLEKMKPQVGLNKNYLCSDFTCVKVENAASYTEDIINASPDVSADDHWHLHSRSHGHPRTHQGPLRVHVTKLENRYFRIAPS